jgi:hypothetical protein
MEALVGEYQYAITASTLDGASHSTGPLTLTVPCGFIREPSTPNREQTWLIRPEDAESSKPTAELLPALTQDGCQLKYSVSHPDLEVDKQGRFVKVKDSLKWKKDRYYFTVTAEIVGTLDAKMTTEGIWLAVSCGIGSAALK